MKAQRQVEDREPGWGVEGWERTERKSEARKDRRNLGVGGEGEGGWGAGEAGSGSRGGGGGRGVRCALGACAGGAVPAPARPAASPPPAAGPACPRAAAAAPSPAASAAPAPAAVAVGVEPCGLKGCTRHGDSTAPEGGPTPAHFWKADPYWTVRAGLHPTGDGGERGWLQLVSTNLSTLT